MKKYDPLQNHLAQLSNSGKEEWNTNFKAIESVLGTKLPPSAFKYPEWWANEKEKTSKVQCHAWRLAGWRTAFVNLSAKTITFIKVRNETNEIGNALPKKSLSLNYSWLLLGSIYVDHKARLKFPKTQTHGGVYKFVINKMEATFLYIGESDNLRRRFQHYRTPGPTQSTNIRLNQIMLETLSNGGKVDVYITSDMKLQNSSLSEDQFKNKNIRQLFECAAIEVSSKERAFSLNL